MSLTLCTRCRTIQPIEASCLICGVELGTSLPIVAKPHHQIS